MHTNLCMYCIPIKAIHCVLSMPDILMKSVCGLRRGHFCMEQFYQVDQIKNKQAFRSKGFCNFPPKNETV